MEIVSKYLTRPLRSEQQAREDRKRREAAETHAAPRGLAEGVACAAAFYAAFGTVVHWVLP